MTKLKERKAVNNLEILEIKRRKLEKRGKNIEKTGKNMAIFCMQNPYSPVISVNHISKIKNKNTLKNKPAEG